jgi:hypothetical protein
MVGVAGIPVDAAQEASTFLSPSTLYFLALYSLVIIVRFFKLKKETTGEWDWRNVFHVALEFVYTSSGLVVMLLEGLKAYVPFIIIVYLILVLVSSQIESMEERFSAKTTFYTHLGIILVIVITTVLYFELVQRDIYKKEVAAKVEEFKRLKSYRVVIPYEDKTLRAHVGPRLFGDRLLAVVMQVSASNDLEAKEIALQRFWDSAKPYRENESAKASLVVGEDLITAEFERR